MARMRDTSKLLCTKSEAAETLCDADTVCSVLVSRISDIHGHRPCAADRKPMDRRGSVLVCASGPARALRASVCTRRSSSREERVCESDCIMSSSRCASATIMTEVYELTGSLRISRRIAAFPWWCTNFRLCRSSKSRPPSINNRSRSAKGTSDIMWTSLPGTTRASSCSSRSRTSRRHPRNSTFSMARGLLTFFGVSPWSIFRDGHTE
mmetsp:Transcript_7715/g.17861  ORF Transcript_7715/g.17861 Transcript_7715/m.17861 type:complete len:209 (-) Transcript_7715:1126-1752(-)